MDEATVIELRVVAPELRSRLGPQATEGLIDMFARYHEVSSERFELKLERGLDGIRLEMERTRADILKWNFLMWLGQFAAITAVLSFLLTGR